METSSDFELIASLLPDSSAKPTDDDDDDADAEDILREATLLLLRLTYGQAHAQLQSLEQEIQILRSAPSRPPEAPEDPRRAREHETDDMWRLDSPLTQGGPDGKGPLLDSSGRVGYIMLCTHSSADSVTSLFAHSPSCPRLLTARRFASRCSVQVTASLP